jgi:diguanylate cyclase (GGDEF)-like protein
MALGRFLLCNARTADSVIRLGGDEFAVLLVADDTLDPAVVARRLKDAATTSEIPPFTLGWAVRSEGETLEQTLSRADRGLLEARARERRWQDRRRARRG